MCLLGLDSGGDASFCSYQLADSHQLCDSGESGQYLVFHLDWLYKVVPLCPVEWNSLVSHNLQE